MTVSGAVNSGRVIDSQGLRLCAHALCHEVLCFRVDHAIFLSNQKPGRFAVSRQARALSPECISRRWAAVPPLPRQSDLPWRDAQKR